MRCIHKSSAGWPSSLLAAAFLMGGCSPGTAPTPSSAPPITPAHDHAAGKPHSGHGEHAGHGSHTGHADHAAATKPGRLVIHSSPESPEAGEPVDLSLTIPDEKDQPIREFNVVHEKRAHLIVVREGLDQFAHLHPEIDAAGTLTIRHTFPQGGRYRLFVDYQPKGGKAAVATEALVISGEVQPPPTLAPTGKAEIADGDVRAHIETVPNAEGVRIRYRLTNAEGTPLADLEPYLGAMGHLVVIGAMGMEYVHAHPLGDTTPPADGVVEFETHLPGTGLFKAWGQFQHQGRIATLPAVIEFEAKP